MKLIVRYLKPFTWAVLFCIALLFVQAMTDLSLPNYMSDIVNVGIQQGGVENGAPDAISEDGMELLNYFTREEEKAVIEKAYRMVEPSSTEAKEYQKKYPLAENEAIYVLSEKEETKLLQVDRIYGNATFSLMTYITEMAEKSGQKLDPAGSGSYADMDIKELYKILPMLKLMPPKGTDLVVPSQSDSMIGDQVGVTFKKMFYKEVGIDTDAFQREYIMFTGLKMLGVALLSVLAAVLVGFIASRISSKVAKNLRHDVFEKAGQFSSAEFDKFSTASLITRTTNDVQQVQTLINLMIRMLFLAPIMGIGGVVMALQKSASMSWIIVLTVLVLIGVMACLLVVTMPKSKLMQKLTDKLNLVSRENLTGMMVIRAFGNEKFEENRFDQANQDLSKTSLFVNRVMNLAFPFVMLIINLTSLLIVWVGSHAIAESTLQIGDMMAFLQYSMQIIFSFLMIAMMFIFVPRASVSATRIREVLDTDLTIKDQEHPILFDHVDGEIKFTDVHFRFENAEEDVLEGISFVARPGETTAFIGSTGSGKSTLINLIPRFYDVTSGSIEIDGKDVRQISQKKLLDQIGYIPQKGMLFTGDIASNLSFGKENATESEMKEAIETAQAAEFVFGEHNGLSTPISQGGANVSGGQRQRLSIARALVKKAAIYIFDDSFSALDFKTDANLRKALKNQTGSSTVLIVAQRISTIMHAEQIIVLDEGKIVGKGTHRELLKNCSEYLEIAQSQFKEEDLA